MANLVFPQLSSGAIAQYPIRKVHTVRTIKNLLPDGNMLLHSDPYGASVSWNLEYIELSADDLASLQTLFANCVGPFHAFTFIDPTDNMLAASSDLTNASAWSLGTAVQLSAGQSDPVGGAGAFSMTNNGQASQGLMQTLPVPASYQYCFSVFIQSSQVGTITLALTGSSSSSSQTFQANGKWSRVVLSTRLIDPGQTVTASLTTEAGQTVQVYGPQLEAQMAPSRYRETAARGGVYGNAHWASNHFPVVATAPGQFSTSFSIEASL